MTSRSAGGVAANYIAKWDGSTWSALGSGMMVIVDALAMDGAGNLYAGGFFAFAGGVAANNIAKWNGSTWSALGSGMMDVAVDGAAPLRWGRFTPVAWRRWQLDTWATRSTPAAAFWYLAGGLMSGMIQHRQVGWQRLVRPGQRN